MTIQDSTRSIGTSAKRFFSGTLISRMTGLAREVAMAAAFGADPMIAAFWMAFRFANLLRRIFGEGALHVAFIPHYEGIRKQDEASGARFFYDLSVGVVLILMVILSVFEAILGGWLLFGSPNEAGAQVIRLTMVMLPAALFISLFALNSSFLNCQRSYFLPSAAPSILNLIWVGAVIWLRKEPLSKAVESLALIVVLAFVAQWALTLPQVLRYLFKLETDWKQRRYATKEMVGILRPFGLSLIGVTATQINSACDGVFARFADLQGPAYLWYALRIQQLPLALFGVGLMGALLPPISRAIQKGEKGKYLQFINFALKQTFVWMIPLTFAVLALGFSGINLVYGHGEFSQKATLETTLCLGAYGLSLLPMTVVFILAAAFYASQDFRIPTFLAAGSVVCNLGVNALFVFYWQLGSVSIAFATTVGACVNCLALGYFLNKKEGLNLEGVLSCSLKTILASLIAAAASISCGAYFFQDNTLSWILRATLHPFPRDFSTQLLVFGVQGICFATVFLASAFLLRLSDLFEVLNLRRKASI